MVNILLTGDRQVGKTTVCKQVAELARGLGYDPAGVLAPAILDKGGPPVAYRALMVCFCQDKFEVQKPLDTVPC